MRPDDLSLDEVLRECARRGGDRTAAISEDDTEISWKDLEKRTAQGASGLAAAGIEHGDRIALLGHNSLGYFELLLAIMRRGAVAYPINWRLKPEEIERLLARARPRGIAVDAAGLELLTETALASVGGLRLALEENVAGGAWKSAAALTANDPYNPPGWRDPAAIIATAAVEAVPRGALLTHGNLLASNLQEIAALGLGADDTTLAALPLFHIAGLGHTLSVLHAGGSVVIAPRFDARTAVEAIDRHAVTHISSFPPVLSSLLDAAGERGSKLASLRHVTGLDGPPTIERLNEQTDAHFWIGFGQTETSGFVTLQRADERPGAAGRPGELCAVRVVDEFDRNAPVGEAGEILVRGPLVFAGYADEPEVTEYTFRGGWHHTGDVGRFDDDGYLWYVKRMPEKELIKPGGENVYPAEVESVIVEMPEARAACVFGVPHERWGEGILAVVETTEDHQLDEPAVIEYVGSRIARYKKPHFVHFTTALPRNEDGNIDRDAARATWGSLDRGTE